ncbi:hypothetical protein [Nitrosomonas eutropha]|uniref:hypothetical protein n=1 Tax=Nitrosomonas eutropha TaxID=916 RepID=UPI0009440332|nr:hypothetical protein [Nitrosomonas eutropha]
MDNHETICKLTLAFRQSKAPFLLCWKYWVYSIQLCDDDDGGLLQPEAIGLLQRDRNQGFLIPEMGQIANARGDSG